MTAYLTRLENHKILSTRLSKMSLEEIKNLCSQSQQIYDGIGGSAKIIEIYGIKIFVKSIPLTILEQKPEHREKLTNLFNLPLYCHYGIGSPGFTAWREIHLHELTTSWVLDNKCTHFPILYHWREISSEKTNIITEEQRKEIQEQIQYWDESLEVGDRIQQKFESDSQILLFLEFIPHTLYNWIGEQLKTGETEFLHKIQSDLKETNDYMYENGLVHFDAHFENILTDGISIYYTDFGLSLSRSFGLSQDEEQFFLTHKNYDDFSTLTNLLHAIVTNSFAPNEWNLRLKEYINGELGEKLLEEYLAGQHQNMEAQVDHILRSCGPAVLRMDVFYRSLQHQSKSTLYPAEELEQLRCNFNGSSNGC